MNEENSDFETSQINSTHFKKPNKTTEAKDKTGIAKVNDMRIIKKDQDFWNTVTWNVRRLTGKENELIGELGITETKKKGGGKMKIGGQLLIYKEGSGHSRAKERVGCFINKKYKRFKSKWISETERFPTVELKMKENVTQGPIEDENVIKKIKLCAQEVQINNNWEFKYKSWEER